MVASEPSQPHVAPSGDILGLSALTLNVGDLRRSVPFYRDVLGLELRRGIGSFEADPRLLKLHDASGASYRTASFTLLGAPQSSGITLVEHAGVSLDRVRRHIQDPGAATVALYVKDVVPYFNRLKAARAPILTSSGQPVRLPEEFGRVPAVFVADPDGFVIGIAEQPEVGSVLAFTVGDAERAARFYGDVLGFEEAGRVPFTGDRTTMDLVGTPGAQMLTIALYVPGTSYQIELFEFKDIDRRPLLVADQGRRGASIRPGVAIPSFNVRDLGSLLPKLRSAGARVLTAGSEPVWIGADLNVIVADPNDLLIHFVQRASQ